MELSYWERKTWFANIDFTIVGSGIVGLSTAVCLKERFPKAKIVILEKGVLPQGASTKNAGFACFGSISEVLSDLESHTEQEVFQLVEQRFQGIDLLRKTLGDKAIGFEINGGHELFLKQDELLFEKCRNAIPTINELLAPIFGENVFQQTQNTMGFQSVLPHYITQTEEGQLDTGKMLLALIHKAQQLGVLVFNAVTVLDYEDIGENVSIRTSVGEFTTKSLLLATNGFTNTLVNADLKPARAQVLVTKPIQKLPFKGTFHFDEGYYYFRNIDNRVLFGGGRNLDFDTEETMEFGQTNKVQEQLKMLLKTVILPDTPFEIDQRWSGIMGIGHQKTPIIKQLSDNVFCGVRLGGMGIAIGSAVGEALASLP